MRTCRKMGRSGNILIHCCLGAPLICEAGAVKVLTPALTAPASQITISGAAMNRLACGKEKVVLHPLKGNFAVEQAGLFS